MTAIQSESIDYAVGERTHSGYLAAPDNGDARPGVIIIHEWWGLNDYIRQRANQLAGLGYTALAIDMYGEGQLAANPDEAGALMNEVLGDMETGTRRLEAGLQTLAGHSRVDGGRIAAIGYCFGGAMALHMARIGLPIKAAVSFHGALGSFHKPATGEVKARILICHGGDDTLVPEQDVAAFKAEMDEAQADYSFETYPGALHGFTSTEADANGKKYGLPLGYQAEADHKSWAAMQALFNDVLQD